MGKICHKSTLKILYFLSILALLAKIAWLLTGTVIFLKLELGLCTPVSMNFGLVYFLLIGYALQKVIWKSLGVGANALHDDEKWNESDLQT